MDENIWKVCELIICLVGIQTTVIIAAFGGMWCAISKRFDATEKRLDKIDENLTDVDRRICRIEGALNNKECCMLKDSRLKEKID